MQHRGGPVLSARFSPSFDLWCSREYAAADVRRRDRCTGLPSAGSDTPRAVATRPSPHTIPRHLDVPRECPTAEVSGIKTMASPCGGVCGFRRMGSPWSAREGEHTRLHTHMVPHGPRRRPPRTSGKGGFGVHLAALASWCRWSPQHAGGDILRPVRGHERFQPRNTCVNVPSQDRDTPRPLKSNCLPGPFSGGCPSVCHVPGSTVSLMSVPAWPSLG